MLEEIEGNSDTQVKVEDNQESSEKMLLIFYYRDMT